MPPRQCGSDAMGRWLRYQMGSLAITTIRLSRPTAARWRSASAWGPIRTSGCTTSHARPGHGSVRAPRWTWLRYGWTGGSRIVFSKGTGEGPDLFSVPADGAGAPELLFKSASGKWASFVVRSCASSSRSEQDGDIWLLNLSGSPTAEPFLRTAFDEEAPTFSPNGTLDCVPIKRERTIGDLCAAITRAGEKVADLDRRRPSSTMVAERRRTALYERATE